MKNWISISITIYEEYPQRSRAHFFYDDDQADIHLDHILSYEEGMKALRKAEKLLNRTAAMAVNPYCRTICTKEVYGYIYRE